MTQLEQIKTILQKEIKQKQWMQDNKQDTRCNDAYFAGAIASLRYILYMVNKLIENKVNGKSE